MAIFKTKSSLWSEVTETKVKVGIKDRAISFIFEPLIPIYVVPNHITVFRFVSIPFVTFLLFYEYYATGFMLFAVSAFSDALDGAIARTRGQVTDWGKLFDPLADKLLIGVAGFILVSRFLSPFIIAMVISIEILLILNAYYRKKFRGEVVEARGVGKIKMVCQSFGVGLLGIYAISQIPILLFASSLFLYISIVLALISLFIYRSI
ncbi:MAG: CDP-diacylglycerol--glycerol-3-phosphate 3-phosphatidyltransferase [Parcubacteria group bacterium LiPW_30]|nr:MAG: CDP-diacylglycerol--glycerol-3-phosphate 3-phosphatidyltransferase [Parcubacteria group bacterium LiPW_30]